MTGTPRTISGRRIAPVLATCAITALVACAATPTAEPTRDIDGGRASFSTAACPDPSNPGMPEFKLGAEFRCGYLSVPENWAAASGRTVRLPVAILPSASATPKPDPIVYLAGGPGGSGPLDATGVTGWNVDRDVIFVGQRGTLHGTPSLTCPEIDRFKADVVDLPIDDPATRAISDAAVTACHDRLLGEGWDLSDFNTTQNANDIAALRRALGVAEWNVYGVSYGTSLAQQLLRDHPAGIRTVTIDGVVPPSLLPSRRPSPSSTTSPGTVSTWSSTATGSPIWSWPAARTRTCDHGCR